MINPYKTPETEIKNKATLPDSVEYFSVFSIVISSVIISPMGGGILIAINYERMGRFYALGLTLLVTLLLMILSYGIVFSLLKDLTSVRITASVVQIVLVIVFVKILQGNKLESHQNAGGKFSSTWIALGVSLLGYFVYSYAINKIYEVSNFIF